MHGATIKKKSVTYIPYTSKLFIKVIYLPTNAHVNCLKNNIKIYIKPFQTNFSANCILPSSYLFWAGRRLVDYL